MRQSCRERASIWIEWMNEWMKDVGKCMKKVLHKTVHKIYI